jgi:acetolactate synthase-1/3 small subunit
MTEIKKDPTHTISILVANKPGVLVRVALVFARRGYNIDSLVVSPSFNPKFSRMTITAKGNLETLDQIIKNVSKLIDVIHASEHDSSHSVDRELALIKMKDTPAIKSAIAKYSKKYHAKIVDTQDKTLIIAQSGATAELDELELLLKKLGVLEYVRSGKLLMARGKEQT